MNGEYHSVHFEFRSEKSERIADFDFEPDAGKHEHDTPANYLTGNVTILSFPFYVYAFDKNKSEAPFMRVLSEIFDLSSNINFINATFNSNVHRSVGLSSKRLLSKQIWHFF